MEILERFNALRLWDFWVESFGTSKEVGNDVLVIHAGQDFPDCYATLRFNDTEYISCPMLFHHARFRLATEAEVRMVRHLVEYESTLFAVDTDVCNDVGERTYFVAAKTVAVDLPAHE